MPYIDFETNLLTSPIYSSFELVSLIFEEINIARTRAVHRNLFEELEIGHVS